MIVKWIIAIISIPHSELQNGLHVPGLQKDLFSFPQRPTLGVLVILSFETLGQKSTLDQICYF